MEPRNGWAPQVRYMGMNGVNLIPAPRRLAKRRRTHLRYCVAGCAGWAVLCVGAAVGAHAVWRAADPQAAERLGQVVEEMQRTERATAALRTELAAAQSTLRSNEAIAAQPDWSILLGLLGQQVGDEVVLKSCNIRPGTPRGVAAAGIRRDPRRGPARTPSESPVLQPGEPQPFVLEASGLALDLPAVNQFVLRLELTGLFSRVTLLDTAKEPFFDKNATAFRIECALNQSPPPDPTAGATARRGE